MFKHRFLTLLDEVENMEKKNEVIINFVEIENNIETDGWFFFGKKEFVCPGLTEKNIGYYLENNKLPSPCDICYKALFFWDNKYSKENLMNFFSLMNSLNVDYRGKLNRAVVVFYFRDKNKMLNFIENVENDLQKYNVEGKTQWRKACKAYQISKPQLWKNAKIFLRDVKNHKTLMDY